MIPAYPSFKPLEKSDQPLLEKAFADNPPEISEYTFPNLYAWRNIYQFHLSLRDGSILLRATGRSASLLPFSRDKGPAVFFPPIGKDNPKETMLATLTETGGCFARVPETQKDLFERDTGVLIDIDPDNSDYLFLTDELVHLKGKKYDGKRNLIKKFKSTCRYEYVTVGNDLIRECVDFADEWCVVKGCDTIESLDDERKAFKEMLANFSDFDLRGGAIRIEGKMRALVLGQRLNPQTLVIHVLKAYAGIAGLYQAVFNEFLSRQAGDFRYVNMEQDLGVAGLRKAKLSYHPVTMINKYTLRLA